MKIKIINETTAEIDGVRYTKEDSRTWLDIAELNISVEIEIHDKDKSFKELGLANREAELMTSEECKFIMNTPKYAKILKMDGSSSEDDFFIKQPFNLSRKNGYVARFFAGLGYAGLYCNVGSSVSVSDLGVRFVRRIKEKKE